MKASQSFQKIFSEARDFLAGDPHVPVNPVVRCCGGIWTIESALIPCDDDCTVEEGLSDFQGWFHELMANPAYIPDKADEEYMLLPSWIALKNKQLTYY